MRTYAERTNHLQPEGAYQVLARAQALEAAGRHIIHLEIGQPDFDTFENIAEAGRRAIAEGKTRYTPPSGIPELRQAIAGAAGAQRGVRFLPEQVVVAAGTKPNMFGSTLALVRPGDEVLYPDPGFPTYKAMVQVAGGVPIPVPLEEENGFSFDLGAFDRLINERTRLIILNSPSNPTGGVTPRADLEYIAEAAHRYDCWVLSDEIYMRLVYDGHEAPSIVSIPGMAERTILIDGFSKTYAMTGWRLGYGIMPLDLARRMDLLLTHSVGCPAHFTQVAALEALRGPQDRVAEVLQEYQARRDLLVSGLNAIPGVTCQVPQGAFYCFPNVKSLGVRSSELADYLLEEAGIAVLPGTAFGGYGEGYLRLSYSTSRENLLAGLEALRAALSKLNP
jgi:aspartate/methionine/tyrosine aminotransferase